MGLPPSADPSSVREHLQDKVPGEFIVAISDVKANSHQGFASRSSTQHRWNIRPFFAVWATRLPQLSTSFRVVNTRMSVPVEKGEVEQRESSITVVTQKTLTLISPAEL